MAAETSVSSSAVKVGAMRTPKRGAVERRGAIIDEKYLENRPERSVIQKHAKAMENDPNKRLVSSEALERGEIQPTKV